MPARAGAVTGLRRPSPGRERGSRGLPTRPAAARGGHRLGAQTRGPCRGRQRGPVRAFSTPSSPTPRLQRPRLRLGGLVLSHGIAVAQRSLATRARRGAPSVSAGLELFLRSFGSERCFARRVWVWAPRGSGFSSLPCGMRRGDRG